MSTSPAETADQDRLSKAEYRDRLRELPPSAKLVGEAALREGGVALQYLRDELGARGEFA